MNAGSPRPPRLWIDGDGCPVVREARRIATRHGVKVTLVAGPSARPAPSSGDFEQVQVSGASEAADDYIASRAGPGELVVTDDLPLADRCLKAGAVVVSSRGVLLTPENLPARLAQRELGKFLRELGGISGGPAPYSEDFRSRFKMVLHEAIEKLRREDARRRPDPTDPEERAG